MVTAENMALSDLCPQALVAGLDRTHRGSAQLTVHFMRGAEPPAPVGAWRDGLAQQGVETRVRRRIHKVAQMEKAATIEALIRPFRHQEIVFDPTGFYGRADGLVRFAAALRAAATPLVGIFWNAEWRCLYVVLEAGAYVRRGAVRKAALGAAEDLAVEILTETCGSLAPDFAPLLRLGFELPQVPVVPVDAASYRVTSPVMAGLKRYGAIPALGALFGFGLTGTALAGDNLPAVSGPNGKIALGGGYQDDDDQRSEGLSRLLASYTIPLPAGSPLGPLGDQVGLQIDGALGFNDDDFTGGVGGHLFWRDPARGLVGAIGSYAAVERSDGRTDADLAQFGGEGEIYLDALTLFAAAGGQFGNHTDDGVFARGGLAWYFTDDLMVGAGGSYDAEREGLARFNAEFQPAIAGLEGLTLFGDTLYGDNDRVEALVGLRFYFGAEAKSLRRRHREDDPVGNTATTTIDSLGNGVETDAPVMMIYLPPLSGTGPVVN